MTIKGLMILIEKFNKQFKIQKWHWKSLVFNFIKDENYNQSKEK